jgi:hypothetical protein
MHTHDVMSVRRRRDGNGEDGLVVRNGNANIDDMRECTQYFFVGGISFSKMFCLSCVCVCVCACVSFYHRMW